MSLYSKIFSQSSLVPLAKIASASSRTRRVLWIAITVSMLFGLFVCITLVILQYSRHQTVFQLDYSSQHIVYDQTPAVTICPETVEISNLFKHLMAQRNWKRSTASRYSSTRSPWGDPEITTRILNLLSENQTKTPGVIGSHLPNGELHWNTDRLAKSPIYKLLHNFSVKFSIKPAQLTQNYHLFVLEQIPHKHTFMCTTFELITNKPDRAWSYVEITIVQNMQTAAIATGTSRHSKPGVRGSTFVVIKHERGELPFSAYDRNIHTILEPATQVSVYFSKSVTRRLNTARNPCHDGADAAWLINTKKSVETKTNDLLKHEDVSKRGFPKVALQFDYLDRKRQEIQNTLARSRTRTLSYLPLENGQPKDVNLRRFNKKYDKQSTLTINLFNTKYLYSREACGWSFCCRTVAIKCNCTCSMDWLLSSGDLKCPHIMCENKQCTDQPIPYEVCPMPCVISKFIKQNLLVLSATESGLSPNMSVMKLIRSENVQVATEEEIYSLTKLFSEIGGLCSLFIGFSCIFIFELIEAVLLLKRDKEQREKKKLMLNIMENQIYCCAKDNLKGVGIFERNLAEQASDKIILPSNPLNDKQAKQEVCDYSNELQKHPTSNDKHCLPKYPLSENRLTHYEDTVWGETTDIITLPLLFQTKLLNETNLLDALKNQHSNSKTVTYLVADSGELSKAEVLSLIKNEKIRFRLIFPE